MSESIKITTKDICEALNIGRHQLRSWTDSLAPYSHRETKERSASRYDFGDLLFFAVIQHLNGALGIAIPFIAGFSESLYKFIRRPQDMHSTSLIFVNVKNRRCTWVVNEDITQEGIVVDLQPAQARVYKFLGISSQQQTQLQLGLLKVN